MEDDNLHELDSIFTLPAVIEDQQLRLNYEIIIARLRRMTQHLADNMIIQLLIERIAYNYVTMRWFESRRMFAHTSAQKDFNLFWHQTVREFNQMVAAHDEAAKQTLLKQIAEVIMESLAEEDTATASRLRSKFAQALTEAGF